MRISLIFCIFVYTKIHFMEDREREYLKENMLRLERWEETPSAPSGRSSDLTEVEKEKLIDLLFANNEKLMSELAGMRSEIERLVSEVRTANDGRALWQQRSAAAERRAETAEKRAGAVEMKAEADRTAMQDKIDRLLSLVEELRNGNELRAMAERAEKAEKMVADLLAEVRSMRGQAYGTKSQKRRNDDDKNDDARRDAQSEKDNMGGKDTVESLPESDKSGDGPDTDSWVEDNYRSKRAYREGARHRTMKAARRCVHESDRDAVPEGWTIVREEKRFAYDKMTVIVEHEYRYLVVRDAEGNEKVMFLPKNKGEEKWIESRDGEEIEIQPVAPVEDPLRDKGGNHIADCFPHTHATSGMMAQLVTDHFVNNIPYCRLSRYFNDNGMSVSRQTFINWLYEGGVELQKLIPVLLDTAVRKDSIINCDETWCKVRVKGKYAKRYIWCLVNRELKIVIYFYKKGARSRDALKSILGGRYPKALQSDGYNVYLYLDDAVIDTEHLCCMAHARAKFFYAWQANKEADAGYILRIIQELYNLEEHYRKLGLSPDEIKKMRNCGRSMELIIMLRSKIESMKNSGHPPRSELLDKAVNYMDDFWKQLFAYRNDGRYTIDNTLAERFMRPLAGERKNSLFYGSGRMAGIASVYHTLISTCRLMKVSVTEYFQKVFRMIVTGYDNLTSLLPMNMGLAVNNY